MDSSTVLSLAPCIERFSHPCKRPHSCNTKVHRETKLKKEDKDHISMLLDECVYEIFRCLPATRDCSVCACVSKRWLMLQSSLQRSEIKRSKTNIKNPTEMTTGNKSVHSLSDDAAQFVAVRSPLKNLVIIYTIHTLIISMAC